jgi:bifunctional non-homologous end joining protein LigD
VTITHPDRILFPEDGLTKADVAAYYHAVADRMVPFLAGRPLSVERFPRGIGEDGFMQKNRPGHAPEAVGAVEMDKRDGVTIYPIVDDEEGLLFFVNLSAITFHVPTLTVADDVHPDWLIWDLDPPDDGAGIFDAARTMRAFLDDLGVPTVLMATGSHGFHLRTPIVPDVEVGRVDRLARGSAMLAEAAHADLLTTAFRKADRDGRVFVDWLRNTPRATSVVPYSLRPRDGAPVAAPLDWEELESEGPTGVTLETIEARLGGDHPWAGAEPLEVEPIVERVDALLDEAGFAIEPFDRFRS